MAYDTLLFETEGPVATITFNRPEAMNALMPQFCKEAGEVLAKCEWDSAIRSVIVAANGRAFCAGADVRALAATREQDRARELNALADAAHEQMIVPIRRMAKPVIAAVGGVVAGGGLGVALACDVVVAAAEARFTLAYSNIAVSPDCGATFFLPRLIGPAKAMELYLFNEMLSAEKAAQLGLVYRVVPGADLAATVREIAARLAAGPSFAFGQTKNLLNRSLSNDLAGQLRDEARSIALCASTRDHEEGLEAFLAKRPSKFTGQ